MMHNMIKRRPMPKKPIPVEAKEDKAIALLEGALALLEMGNTHATKTLISEAIEALKRQEKQETARIPVTKVQHGTKYAFLVLGDHDKIMDYLRKTEVHGADNPSKGWGNLYKLRKNCGETGCLFEVEGISFESFGEKMSRDLMTRVYGRVYANEDWNAKYICYQNGQIMDKGFVIEYDETIKPKTYFEAGEIFVEIGFQIRDVSGFCLKIGSGMLPQVIVLKLLRDMQDTGKNLEFNDKIPYLVSYVKKGEERTERNIKNCLIYGRDSYAVYGKMEKIFKNTADVVTLVRYKTNNNH